MTRYQEPGTERMVDVDETSGELLLALGWTVAPPTTDDVLAASLASTLAEGAAPFQPLDAFDPGAHTAPEVLEYLAQAEPAEVARVLIAEAIGKKVDQAAIYGTDKPASWPMALVPGAVAAGVITPGNLAATPAEQRKDAGQLVADLGLKMARSAGANLSGLIAQAGTATLSASA